MHSVKGRAALHFRVNAREPRQPPNIENVEHALLSGVP
jgi:hypothetical protein